MSNNSTKKGLKGKHTSTPKGTDPTRSRQAAAAAALVADAKNLKRVSPGNGNITADGKLRKRTRKKLSHQQAAEARDTLDAEFRDLRARTINNTTQSPSQLPGGIALAPAPLRTVPEAAGFGPSVQPSEQSVQDLAGILSTL